MSERLERKEAFIRALAEYLTARLGARSIELQMGKRDAQEWARLYDAAGLFGYPTADEAEAALKELLG